LLDFSSEIIPKSETFDKTGQMIGAVLWKQKNLTRSTTVRRSKCSPNAAEIHCNFHSESETRLSFASRSSAFSFRNISIQINHLFRPSDYHVRWMLKIFVSFDCPTTRAARFGVNEWAGLRSNLFWTLANNRQRIMWKRM
jgi:hypothetical protein